MRRPWPSPVDEGIIEASTRSTWGVARCPLHRHPGSSRSCSLPTTRDESVQFYTDVFGFSFDPNILSFTLGNYGDDSFFLLTVENWYDVAQPSCFGISVDDVGAIHQRALERGATEVSPPADFDWKPRCSVIDDPSGNRIQLSQA